MFDRRKVLGRGVRGGDAPFPEEEAARGNRAASYMQILSLATMRPLHLLLYFALCSIAILHCVCKFSNILTLGYLLRTLQYHPLHFMFKSSYFVFASFVVHAKCKMHSTNEFSPRRSFFKAKNRSL